MKPRKSLRFYLLTLAATGEMALFLCSAGGCGGAGNAYDSSRPQQDTPTTATYKTARCTDGSYTYSKQPEIFCDSRGGIDQRYDRPY